MTSLEGWSSAIELRLQMMADLTRIELAIFSVTGRHVSHYTTDPRMCYYYISNIDLQAFFKFILNIIEQKPTLINTCFAFFFIFYKQLNIFLKA